MLAALATAALPTRLIAGAPPRPSTALPSVHVLPPMAMPGLDRSRTVRVCLPPSYEHGDRRYPVVYMHDGQNLFDDATSYAGEWGVDETLLALARETTFEAIVVGIDHGGERRVTELNPWDHARFGRGEGRAYLRFLVDVVKPRIDAGYRTRPGREHTAIIGSSMGGLISHAALLLHPDRFARAGVLSPAYWTAPALFDLARDVALPDDARLYLSIGSEEGERALADARRMASLLRTGPGRHVTLQERRARITTKRPGGRSWPRPCAGCSNCAERQRSRGYAAPMTASTAALDRLIDPLLDRHHKGYPHAAPALRLSQIGTQGWSLLAGDLPLPLAVIKQGALQHNLGWMQRFANERQLGLAPHGKTTMSPQLFRRQLDAGAWGLTFATVGQATIGVASGATRCLIANQVISAGDLAALAALHEANPDLRTAFLLDSPAQLALIEATRPARPFDVLLEIGVPDGRTGCRSEADALTLAAAAHASAAVRLVGVECFEGLSATGDDALDQARTGALMQRLHVVAQACDHEGLFEGDEVILSAGGSGIFDLVVPTLQAALSRPVQGLLRSGCYVTHDQGHYKRLVAQVNHRIGCDNGLQAALEVWALVQSCPEPGLAILAVGKRDVSYDMALPQPLWWCAAGSTAPVAAPTGWAISGLNDQHAYLRCGDDPPAVGDRIGLGISHPCTTFDKWRWMPIVDDAYRVVDAIVTCF